MLTIETATLEEKKQAKEIANYIIEHFKSHFNLYKIIKEYYYCFIGDDEEKFDIILDSLNYKLIPLIRKDRIKNIDEYFEKEVNNITNESIDNR